MAEKIEKEENKKAEKNSAGRVNSKIPFLEWLTAAIGSAMVAVALGFIVYTAAASGDKPPVFIITHQPPQRNGSGYLVKFEVENGGDLTAADVVIEGKLLRDAQEIETSSVTLDYAPAHSKRGGGLYFKNDPTGAELEILAKAYQEP